MTTQADPAAERHRLIAERLDDVGRVEVGDLATRLDVAAETIRRDLRLLEQQGLLQRVHGGAVRRTPRPLSPFDGTTPQHPPEQMRLADQVVDALPRAGTVYLGASSLTSAVAESLSRRAADNRHGAGDLTIVTSSLDVAVLMSRVGCAGVYNIGGSVAQAEGGQQGEWAVAELERFRVDLSLLSVAGLTAREGMFADSPVTAAMIAAEAAAARRVWVLLDAERLGRPGFVRAAPLDGVERVFAAGATDAGRAVAFRDAGIPVIDAHSAAPRRDAAGPDRVGAG